MPNVYAGKLARINLTTREIKIETIREEWVQQYTLGSGLAAKIFYAEMDATLDALDPRAPLIALNGLLSGTFAPTGCRSSWCGRSPLTGIWNESNMGGHFGAEMRFAGYDGFILTGRAPEPTYLWIDGERGTIEFRSAQHLWGLDHFDTFEKLRGETDAKAQIACIGQAGEKLVRIASIMQGGHDHARTAGRGGMGAVLGSKNLKAIVVRGKQKPVYADAKKMGVVVREQNNFIHAHAQSFMEYGTAGGLPNSEAKGGLPINNWRDGSLAEAMKISGQRLHETIWVKHTFCHACPIGCGKEIEIKDGKFAGTRGEGPEYETLAFFGSNLKIIDLEAISKANDLCNRYGLDTISTGGAIAFAFEAYEKGLLTRAQCNDLDLSWGNADAMLALVDAIALRRGIGNLLAEGVERAAKKLNASELNMTVKGLEMPAHDPRAFFPMAVNYATASRGACHLEACTYWNTNQIFHPDLGYSTAHDAHDSTIGAQMAVDYQNYLATYNPLGICKFIARSWIGPDQVVDLVNTAMGWQWTRADLLTLGEKLFNLKRLINQRYGISRAHDTLPARLLTQPRPTGKSADVLPDLDLMLRDYYALRAWDETGAPRAEKLRALGL
ncbi:MAG: aldehyde ferredoxin oxidoreductase family protein [Chloroflexi bacterium]|nr:aldehyde ferredoxin oxidoreductase family protein [Chloroflexota bacterium]